MSDTDDSTDRSAAGPTGFATGGPDTSAATWDGSDGFGTDGASVVEVRTSATAALIPTIRAVASDLAARADFDLDAISDLRMAVDEACATLVDVAAPGSGLRCRFRVLDERIEVSAEVSGAGVDTTVATDTFGWRVLQTLTDEVSVRHDPGPDGRPVVGIVLGKSAGTTPR